MWKPYTNGRACVGVSPEPGRTRIFVKRDDSAAGAWWRAKRRAPGRSVQWLRRRNASKWVGNGNCRQAGWTNKICRNSRRKEQCGRPRNVCAKVAKAAWLRLHEPAFRCRSRQSRLLSREDSQFAEQAKEILRQRCEGRANRRSFRVNDDVPSCGYLLPMTAHDFTQSPPDAIAHHRAAQCLLNAETEAIQGQFVGTNKDGEVGTGKARTGLINAVKISPADQASVT